MDKEELIKKVIKICKDHSIANRYLVLGKEERKILIELTSFLDESYEKAQMSQRIYHVDNDIFEIVNCKWCGKPMVWSKDRKKYCVHKKCLPLEIKESMSKIDEKTIEIANQKRKETNRKKYGVDFASQTKETIEKTKQTMKEKYGVTNHMKLREFQEKVKETTVERYGMDNYSKTEEFKEKSTETFIKKYGVDNPAKLKETHELAKQTMKERYGAEHYSKTKEFKERAKKTNLERYGVDNYFKSDEFKEKAIETNLEKYGAEHYSKTEEFKQKYKETNLEKYGVDDFSKTEEFKKKAIETNKEKYKKDWYLLTDKSKEEYQRKVIRNFNRFLEKFDLIGKIEYVKNLHNGSHELKCLKCGNNFEINTKGFYYNRTRNNHELCPICNPLNKTYSHAEKEVLDYIKSIYSGEIIENTRKIIYPYELDIYLPDLQLAIEYNGLYWHSSEQKDKDYHQMKSDLCKEKRIHLIHIFEDDWFSKQEIWKSVLSNFINQSFQTTIYGRKCTIQKVLLSDCNKFLTDNHLLGSISAFSKCYGLYFNDELVSLMTFKLISKETNQYELSRYAIKKNYRIIGGAEKILSHFKKEMCGIASSIITYNDNSVFKGKVYEKLGFQYIRTNAPNYMFISEDTDYTFRFPKQSIRKLKVGYTKEVEQQLGYLRVYNAGNDVYVMDF